MRTSTISSISYINDRNRKKNVEEAEKAILVNCQVWLKVEILCVLYFQEELKANKGKKIDDPFTRRSTKPCMKFRAKTNSDNESSSVPDIDESKKDNIDTTDSKVS